MTAAAPRSTGLRGLVRKLVAAGLLLTILALPALLAGANVDAPPQPGEVQRLAAALRGAGSSGPAGSEVARQFYLATVVPEPAELPKEPVALAAFVSRARLVQLLFLLATSACVYLATLLARGRVQALVACLSLPLLPPVASEGHVLRPETASMLFTAVALLMLQVLALDVHRRRQQVRWRRCSVLVGDGLVAGLALGLAVAALPARGGGLLLPGLVMSVAALHIGLRALRIGRRHGLLGLPIRAINQRLWPWTIASLLAPVAGLLLLVQSLSVPIEALPATASSVALLPASMALRLPLVGLLVVGTIGAVLRVGLRLGRRGRLGPDLVLLAYCAVQLACTFGAPAGQDTLPAAPALAIVLSEGVFASFGLGAWLWLRGRPAVTSARD